MLLVYSLRWQRGAATSSSCSGISTILCRNLLVTLVFLSEGLTKID